MPKHFYSPSTNAFYCDIAGAKPPADAVEISAADHRSLLDANARGKVIKPGPNSQPVITDFQPSSQDKQRVLKSLCDQLVRATDGLVARHRDESEAGVQTTLSADQYVELQAYRRALRELPTRPTFPDVDLPAKPAFL